MAQLYFSAGRPADEAPRAIDGALNLQGRSSQIVATAMAGTAGWKRQLVAFVAFSEAQPGTVPIYRETAFSNPDARTVAARSGAMGGWERLGRIELGQGRIALRTVDGKHVRAEGGGGGALSANATSIGTAETFNPIDRGTGSIALQTSNGRYVCAEGGDSQPLVGRKRLAAHRGRAGADLG